MEYAMIPRVYFLAVAAGLCLAVGWQTIQMGYKLLGWVVWFIGCVNLWILWRDLGK